MSNPLYDAFKDFVVPGISGLGGIAVGVFAIVVAVRSHRLAERVRADENRRDVKSARSHYRDQLFTVADAAMAALIEYGTEMNTNHEADSADARKLRAIASARLRMLKHVSKGDDHQIATALFECFRSASDTDVWQIKTGIMAKLTSYVPLLMSEKRDAGRIISRIERFHDVAVEEHEERVRKAARAEAARAGQRP